MKLDEAIELKEKLFPNVRGLLCETVMKDRVQFMWVIRLLYGNGYEVVKNEKNKTSK